jgi:hypothetical protein
MVVGAFGEIHPRILEALDVNGPVIACEINLDLLPPPKARPTRMKPKVPVSLLHAALTATISTTRTNKPLSAHANATTRLEQHAWTNTCQLRDEERRGGGGQSNNIPPTSS